MIFLIGSGLAIFLSVLLAGKKGKTSADNVLAIWMFFASFDLFIFYYDKSGLIFEFFLLLHAPFLLIYIQSLIRQLPKKKFLVTLHFIPALIAYIYHFPIIIFSSADEISLLKFSLENDLKIYYIVTYVLTLFSGLIYLSLSVRLLYQHDRSIKEQFSYTEKRNLHWIKFLVGGIAIIWFMVLIPVDNIELLEKIFDRIGDDTFDHFIGVLVVLFIFLIGYRGIRQTNIFATIDNKPVLYKKNIVERYARSNLTEKVANELEKKLLHELKEKKLFLNNDITLGELAAQLNINPTYLSQVINERFNTNFCDFINTYRVEEFKSRIQEIISKDENILSLALDCGFNSKSSFNGIFKKHTGITPSDYIRENRILDN